MSALLLLDHPWIATIGWALLHFLWQGLLLWAAVALSLRFLRQAKPSTRYVVACSGLLLALALPVAGILRDLPAATAASPREGNPRLPLAMEVLQDPAPTRVQEPSVRQALDNHLPLIVLIWSLGAGLLSLRFASGLAWVRRLRRAEAYPDTADWEHRLQCLSLALSLNQAVALRVVRALESPVAAGLWRPVIFLPASVLTGMPPELVEALLAHELAHIKRHDYLVNLLQSAVEVLLFYHPAVWWISARIRIEREQICDDLAARALGEPRRLALALQELDLLQLAIPHLAQAAHGGNLMNRIRRLIHPEPRPLAWKAMASILGITAACVTSAAIAATQLQDSPKAPPAPQAPPPPPRPPKPPKPPKPPVPVGSDLNYAFVRQGGKISCSATRSELDAVQELRKSRSGDFLWFRDKGKAYVIEDPAEVAKVRELFKPMDELGQKMDELGKEMKVHGDKMHALGKEMEAASKHGEPHSKEMGALGKQMGVLGKELGTLEKRRSTLERKLENEKLSSTEEKALERQMEGLEKQIEALETRMEELGKAMEAQGQKLEEAHQPMEALGQKMDEAGKPMEEVGERMESVGAQMEKEGEKIEEGLKRLMQEALRSGKALPVTR